MLQASPGSANFSTACILFSNANESSAIHELQLVPEQFNMFRVLVPIGSCRYLFGAQIGTFILHAQCSTCLS